MTEIVLSAQTLIKEGKFTAAQKLLQESPETQQTLCLQALIYRYHAQYGQERIIIEKAHNLYPTDLYIKQRKEWFSGSLRKRLVPRQPLRLPANPDRIPSQETLEQMCFLTTGFGHKFSFHLLVQQIESIKATTYYKNIPIFILDGGLEEQQKHLLLKHFDQIDIKDPPWSLNDSEQAHPHLRATMGRIFMDKNIPGYRYYMWLENDCWVQDENSLHDFLYHTRLYGAGLVLKDNQKRASYTNHFVKPNSAKSQNPKKYDNFTKRRDYYTCNVFCMDATTDFFRLWQKSALEIHQACRFKIGHEQVAFVYAVHKCKQLKLIKPLDYTHCFTNRTEGLPVLGPLQDVLYQPSTLQPLGIICFDGDLLPTVCPLFHLYHAKEPLDFSVCFLNNAFYHKMMKFNDTTGGKLPEFMDLTKDFGGVPMQLASYHYRSWPAEDKEHALALLQTYGQ